MGFCGNNNVRVQLTSVFEHLKEPEIKNRNSTLYKNKLPVLGNLQIFFREIG